MFKREVGDGALAKLPDGHGGRETPNGTVFVHEHQGLDVDGLARILGVSREALKGATPPPSLSPVLRFDRVDAAARRFEARRMRYSGSGGWSHPLVSGSLAEIARATLPHLGRDSLFERT